MNQAASGHSPGRAPGWLPGLMFTLVLVSYVVAVTQRSSLGVAGVDAQARFSANATALAGLAVLQIVVYAAAQIPVGMLLDRFGPARLIISGAALMVAGQIVVAFAPTIEIAQLGRVLVGMGDATTFVSGLRVLSAWFPPRKVPLAQQWFANLGQLGQFVSAVPFAALLHLTGWVSAFLTTASLSVIVVVACLAALRDTPNARFGNQPLSVTDALRKLAQAVARPGTRLGFWAHFTTQFIGNVLGLLWGYPIMVQGIGIAPNIAALLLMLPVIVGMLAGPFMGLLTARYPLRRSNLVIGAAMFESLAWVVLLLWPGTPPVWAFVLVLVIVGVVTTGSTIGFDFARTFNPAASYGSASGVVNIGGFTASAISFLLIGVVLDLTSGGGEPDWSAYRVALWTFPVICALGICALLFERKRTRNRMAAEEGVVVAPLWAALVRRIRRARS